MKTPCGDIWICLGYILDTNGYLFWIYMDIIWIWFGYVEDIFSGLGPARRQPAPAGECLQGRLPGVGQAREVPVGKPVSQSRFTRP